MAKLSYLIATVLVVTYVFKAGSAEAPQKSQPLLDTTQNVYASNITDGEIILVGNRRPRHPVGGRRPIRV
ncbi:MAG: hypothetical protein WBB18_11780 [Nodosilinea sp.]